MRSRQELLEASGYANRPRDFDELLRILDGELRLITLTDPEGREEGPSIRPALPSDSFGVPPSSSLQYYQLTHDYLVPSLRVWLTGKQKETWRGRTELRLAERAELWHRKRESRNLPAWWEWAGIRLLVRRPVWTATQREMMQVAGRYHVVRGLLLVLVLVLLGGAGLAIQGRWMAHTLRDRLLGARLEQVPRIVQEIGPYHRWVDPLLEEARDASDPDRELRIGLALLPRHPDQMEMLYERLLSARPEEVKVLREALLPYQAELTPRLWAELEDRTAEPDRRFRAACALAAYTPEDPRWKSVGPDVVAKLVTENALKLSSWVENLEPVAPELLPLLAALLEGEECPDAQRGAVETVYKAFAEHHPSAFTSLEDRWEELRGQSQSGATSLALAHRQANLGAALVAMERGQKVWPLLQGSPDPTASSYWIERLGRTGMDPRILLRQLNRERDAGIRRSLFLALGEIGPDRLSLTERSQAIDRLLDFYRKEADGGVHGALECVLTHWGQGERSTAALQDLTTGQAVGDRQWFLTRSGLTFVVLPPGTADAGNPERSRRLAVATKEITVGQFQASKTSPLDPRVNLGNPTLPVTFVSWHDAAAYCNWLSQSDGIAQDQWCYVKDAADPTGRQMKPAPDSRQREGYRLPTPGEWESACRANTATRWSCGEVDEDLLGKYACSQRNSHALTPFAVGTLKPNGFGLFDLHGNADEWCHEDGPLEKALTRGGSFLSTTAEMAVTARPRQFTPQSRLRQVGFRPVRSLP
jgi:hypothetical protein